jgi:hypothetical protein
MFVERVEAVVHFILPDRSYPDGEVYVFVAEVLEDVPSDFKGSNSNGECPGVIAPGRDESSMVVREVPVLRQAIP